MIPAEVIELREEKRNPLRFVDPQRLHDVWPEVKAGLEATRAKCASEWLPEDIYLALKTGGAALVMSDEAHGFAVLQRQARPYGACLLVWVLYAPGELETIRRLMYGPLEAVAREAGVQKLEMHGRRGWEQDSFWQRQSTVYTHEVK